MISENVSSLLVDKSLSVLWTSDILIIFSIGMVRRYDTYNQTLNGFIWHSIPLDTKLYIDVTIKLPKNGSRRHAKQGI